MIYQHKKLDITGDIKRSATIEDKGRSKPYGLALCQIKALIKNGIWLDFLLLTTSLVNYYWSSELLLL